MRINAAMIDEKKLDDSITLSLFIKSASSTIIVGYKAGGLGTA